MVFYVVLELNSADPEICVSLPFKTKKEAEANLNAEYQECLAIHHGEIEREKKYRDTFTIRLDSGDCYCGQIQEIEIPDEWFGGKNGRQ